MPSSQGKQHPRPVIVEVRPSNIAPVSPPPSPKAVRFAPSKVTGVSRQLTTPEAWSLYHFELHARSCPQCQDPLSVYRAGDSLCDEGNALAQDVSIHVYHKAGEVYSTAKDNHKHVRVEVPPNYGEVRSLLKGMDRYLRSTPRTVPILSYDPNYPVPPRRSSEEATLSESRQHNTVIIEPANSQQTLRRPGSKSKRKENGYRTTAVKDYDSEPELAQGSSPTRERRGSLYHSDRQRKGKDYHVEIREPEKERRKNGERRRPAFWP